MRGWLLALLVTLGSVGLGQGFVGGDILFDLAAGARRAGMAGVGVALASPDALFANPAALPWVEGVQILSTYADLFGAAHLGAVSVTGPGLGGAGIGLDAGTIGPGLAFRTAGAVLGAGVRLGPVGAGARARLLRPIAPTAGIGGALDLALLWRGPVHIGAVGRSILSHAPVSDEAWPAEWAVGIALPMNVGGMTLTLACDASDVGGSPSFAVGGELGVGWLLVRAGYGPAGIAMGGTVGWGPFTLDWALVLPPVLPPAFRVSFTVRL
ncbi:MAG TPA: hypothetical protein PLC08_01960 [Candidatus Bipolaricaulis sp.]|nr:hypothetical protein [Candidatus Bipolaricaulis sp.]HRS13726.1 hypothetical protein [Candidatus Bipolaricaulis sp.]HRU21566.1 hypothetical protein [Candidatus Bipolaricaulis sp.]